MEVDQQEHWSDYWRRGFLTTLELPTNYDGETAAFWDAQFALLEKHARVLDVCSGNGAVALLARDYADRNGLAFTITALDAASIDTASISTRYPKLARHVQSIDIRDRTLLEECRETSSSIDLITSQFGIEYTNLDASAKNIARMLKPGAHFSLVSHAVDSGIMNNMQRNLDEFALLERIGLFELESTVRQRARFRRKFNRALDAILGALYGEAKSRNSEFLRTVGRTLEPLCKLTLDQYQSGLEEFMQHCGSLRFARARASDLIAVKRVLEQSPAWHNAFSVAGLELLDSGDIHQQGNLHIGAYYRFRKPV